MSLALASWWVEKTYKNKSPGVSVQNGDIGVSQTALLPWTTKSIATHGAILSERKPENWRPTPTHRINEKISTSKRGWLPSSLEIRGATRCLLYLLFPAISKSPVSPWKELKYTSVAQFCSCWPKDGPLDLQALIANGTCIQEFHRTIANKEAVLRVRDHRLPHPPSYTQEPREERASKTAHLPVSPGKALTTYFFSCCLKVHLSIDLHLGADCNPPL